MSTILTESQPADLLCELGKQSLIRYVEKRWIIPVEIAQILPTVFDAILSGDEAEIDLVHMLFSRTVTQCLEDEYHGQ